MRESHAVRFLQMMAGLAVLMMLLGGLPGRGRLSRVPTTVAQAFEAALLGTGDGYMAVVVATVLVAPPIAMLLVAVEGRRMRPRHVWIALATTGIFAVSAGIALLTR